ncbi:MAG TPA: type II toxin-antitoxin system HipA family toxin, partial [Cyclobacteriaceae bacterium]|nr:type II toxin-antitoxin system HipA family toxin [Cyclobacteriaceae bacterium]
TRKDFMEAMDKAILSARVQDNLLNKFQSLLPVWHDFVEVSFLPEQLKEKYNTLLQQRWSRIFG